MQHPQSEDETRVIKVRSIGAAEVQIGRRRITRSTEVVLGVAVYFCVRAGERLTRDEVVEVFWPDAELKKGRHCLRQLLYRLRQKGFSLDEDGDLLYLDPGRVECDITDVLRETWPESAEPWMVEDSGEFLPGFARAISVQFREWLDGTRERLTRQYRTAAQLLMAQARREGRWVDMERWAGVVLRSDPLNDEATIVRAESLALVGSKSTAMDLLDQYVEDLGERAPQIALSATLLRKRISEQRPEWGGRPGREVPLVGREPIMRRLSSAMFSAGQGRGCAVLLLGAPGIGKTRLANELREFAEINGFRTIAARASQSDSTRPLSLAITMASTIQDMPGVLGTSPPALALLTRLCRTASTSTEDAATISPLDIGWALSDAISATSEESRLLLCIDDLHNADEVSREVLSRVVATISASRVLIVATSRETIARGASSLSAFTTIQVSPLGIADATSLVAALAHSPTCSLPPEMVAAIARSGGGNPLFLRELTSHRLSRQLDNSTPQSLVAVIEQRIAHLASTELRLVRLISALGPLANLHRIRALMPTPLAEYDSCLEQLELEGVLAQGDSGSIELHECWHDAIRAGLRGTARAALSLECATLLAGEHSTDPNCTNYWRAAELFAASGSPDLARSQYAHLGETFSRRGLPRQAAEAFKQASSVASAGIRRAELLVKLAGAQNAASLYEEAIATSHSALACAADPSIEAISTRAAAWAHLVDSQLKLGVEYQEHMESLLRAVSVTDVSDDVCQHSCFVALRCLFNAGSTELAGSFLSASRASRERSGASHLSGLVELMYAAERGTAEELDAIERELSAVPIDSGDPSLRLLSRRYRATALRFLGRPEDAAAALRDSVATAKESGSVRDALLACASLVFHHLDHGDLERAGHWLSEAEALRSPAHGYDLDRTLSHARARLHLELGDDASCIAECETHVNSNLVDVMRRRELMDRACLALALARSGSPSARAVCDDAAERLNRFGPGFNEDWAANTIVRSLRALGAEDEATALLDSYVLRRRQIFDRPVPSAFKELLAARARHSEC